MASFITDQSDTRRKYKRRVGDLRQSVDNYQDNC